MDRKLSRISLALLALYLLGSILLAYFFSLPSEALYQPTVHQDSPAVVAALNVIGQAATAAMKDLAQLLRFATFMALFTFIFYISLWVAKRIDMYQLLFLTLTSLLFSFICLIFLGSLLTLFFNPYYAVCFTVASVTTVLGNWGGVFKKTNS